MNVLQSLQSTNLYPIPQPTIERIAVEVGLDAEATMSAAIATSKPYKGALAKVYLFLAEAPNVTEANATYSFSEDDRKAFRRKAAALLEEIGEVNEGGVECGYFGEDF
jgi:hypothetical protein